MPAFTDISDRRKCVINRACYEIFSINKTREFQVTATYYLSYYNSAFLSMIRRTADGKSLVPLCTAVLRRKVTLIMVPLHGLGSDQVDKSTLQEHNINAYYIDQHTRENEDLLHERLEGLTMDEAKDSCTILFVSPQKLAPDSAWFALFESMAKRDLFSLFCIDQAHAVHQDGRAFRTQFNDAVVGIKQLHSLQSNPVPRLIMSATLRPEDQKFVTKLLGDTKPVTMIGDLSRRETRFTVHITGRASSSL
jgi:bloom syndrome protein